MLALLLLAAAPVADALSASLPQEPSIDLDRHPKISSRLVEAVRSADSVAPALLTAYAVPGVAGHELASDLRASGYSTQAEGSRSVDLLAPLVAVPHLAEHERLAFVDYAIAPEPAVVSEGVAAMRADLVHALDRQGAGVKVGVMDLGFDPDRPEFAARVKGTVTFDGSAIDSDMTDHGNACAELVVDVAPLVDLYLIKTVTTTQMEVAFDWAIANGIDVLSVSLGTTIGPFDGTSDVSQALTRAANAGVKVVVSNGNSAGHHWYGAWSDGDGDGLLNFAPADETIHVDMLSGETLFVVLSWNAFPVTDQDYDLYLLSNEGAILAASVNVQSGTQPPREFLLYTAPFARRVHLVIDLFSASGTSTFHLFAAHSGPPLGEHVVAARSVTIPADAVGAIAVGAADVTAGHAYHTYSSQGPTDDGRMKPLVASAAGVSTAEYGASAFYGTSAAAPHVAGVLALMQGERPALTLTEASAILQGASIDVGAPGSDNLTGHGWLDARHALELADVTPPSLLSAVFAPASPAGAGALSVQLTFSDHLAATPGGTVQLEPASGPPLAFSVTGVSQRTLEASATIPSSVANGAATLRVSGVKDWSDVAMVHQDTNATIVLDTLPPVADILPFVAPYANSSFSVAWSASDATTSVASLLLERSLDNA
ncbi:MAG TPA: S8 family serine peptidase, partial [Candidatus Thermoplasmatota archaeon]|nr:S8 family serine peptidase [Candidatus Thermoplasmatota archaeon]